MELQVYARRLDEFTWISDEIFSTLCPNLHARQGAYLEREHG
jgi:hypothetical protein